MALNAYLTATQNLLGTGQSQNLFPNATLIPYINEGRLQIAAQGQCVRVLTPISGPITTITINSQGQGYTNPPTVVITAPDSALQAGPFVNGVQATAVAVLSGSNVTSVTLTNAGQGYFQPIVTLVSGGGNGATAIAIVSGINITQTNQEVYPFSGVNPTVAVPGSGIQSIIAVKSVSILWGTFRYTLGHYSFSKYQAKVRNYTTGYLYIPGIWSQYGQGASGSVYAYPVANQAYQMEWDCLCLPSQINSDTDPEAIPYPWTDCVPFYAAHKAFLQSNRVADAQKMFNEDERQPGLFQQYMKRARKMSDPGGIVSWYGRSL